MSKDKIESIDDLVLVHMTNYIPENGVIKTPKDAKVMFNEEWHGMKYQIPQMRNTVHFALNHEVSPNQNRNIDCRYAIIIPLKDMNPLDFVGGTAVDFYSNKSIELPESAVILCPKEDEELIKEKMKREISIIGFDGEISNGKPNQVIQELGYKVEKGGQYNWENSEAIKVLRRIFKENNWVEKVHMHSSEKLEETLLESIERTVQAAKFSKEIKDIPVPYILMGNTTWVGASKSILSDEKDLKIFCDKMKDIGIPISQEIIDEAQGIRAGDKEVDPLILDEWCQKTHKSKPSEYFYPIDEKDIANFVFNKRVRGEVGLAKIKTVFEKEKDIKLEDFVNILIDVIYGSTPERRKEFIENEGLNFSNFEYNLFLNQDLKREFEAIMHIKDIPFENLTKQEKANCRAFINHYMSNYNNQYGDVLIPDDTIGSDDKMYGKTNKKGYAPFTRSRARYVKRIY